MTDDSPMMKQYKSIKSQYPGTVVFFRMGDFYETFGDDAVITARVLDITLTARGHFKGEKMPLAGIPYHALDTYLHRMVKAGYKVAICEQIEDPKKAKGIVKRDVVRIVSPGTVMEDSMLQGRSNNFLISIGRNGSDYGLAAVDISTGEFLATSFEGRNAGRMLRNEVARLSPSECLVSPDIGVGNLNELMDGEMACSVTLGTAEQFAGNNAAELLASQCGNASGPAPAVSAAGAALSYLMEMQKSSIGQITSIKFYEINDFMMLDSVTLRNLELFGNIRDGGKSGTLFELMDRTLTPMGCRTLRGWLAKPLMVMAAIEERLDSVEKLMEERPLKAEIRENLKDVRDLERLLARSIYGSANARDVQAIANTLAAVMPIAETLGGKVPILLKNIRQNLDPCQELTDEIEKAIAEEPPVGVREGSIIREGYDAQLDELRDMARTGGKWMASLEETERSRTGIKSLKIKYNRVFGYHIEIPISQSGNVPDNYTRKQTMSNAERFITPELKEKESQILTANERSAALEYEIFSRIREKVAAHSERLRGTARALGELDAIASLAEIAVAQNYARPKFDDSGSLAIVSGRHPVVESILSEKFIPNDTTLDMKKNRVMILTGPNMAGKSTYMRQIALIIVMAQMGGFVPATSARLTIVDRVFTRVGAFDDLSRGQSTFMVEMSQVSEILKNATKRSLILLDELGRGTSTFDGLSIAWAVAEYVHSRKLGAKTIFATHYHQLNELEELLDGVVNYNIAVKEEKDDIIFLRKVIPGSTNRSYGIQVAKLAGMPPEVVERAKKLLQDIEAQTVVDLSSTPKSKKKPRTYTQLVMFGEMTETNPLKDELKNLDPDHMTPMQALHKLQELKKKAEGKE
ncbi:MAG: DNA mismatch repair protein MutS [Candidatus Thermoplasmatota archaeon]|nr:DNA mismatch repair protein MutS [Euryarchaeota archaeon]MBU4071983.1 DNA mismatch repair protein MutS [Candidatus Thermoplasmatota archaeon]MBU4145251.1 DNA mismatch repair protein MutS [Candidatus Thermoplasmatota archaeon]MBU4591218.1 DNA mismatch repair protein MutS [Candidatus Thermoplasmatota archaeon]